MIDALFQFFGRLHPMVLHLPIGVTVALVFVELLTFLKRIDAHHGVRVALAWLAALSGVVAVASGLVLEQEGVFSEETTDTHRNLALVTTSALILAAVMITKRRVTAFRVFLALALLAIGPAGHLGASMTHGEGFLFEPFEPLEPQRAPVNSPPTPAPSAAVQPPAQPAIYATLIAPLLAAKCVECHAGAKPKGKLVLDSPAGIQKGGTSGLVVEAGNVSGSELARRLRLGVDDEEHMPPPKKPQLSEDEIRTIEEWIQNGASFEGASVEPPKSGALQPAPPAERAAPVVASPSPALDRLRAAFVHAQLLREGDDALWIDFAAIATELDDARALELLQPLASRIEQLSLARSKIGDATLSLVAEMTKLQRLDLRATKVSDAGVGKLAGHATLADLVLAQTSVSNASLGALRSLPKLVKLSAWRSKLDASALAALRLARPTLVIDGAPSEPTTALETEAAVVFAKPAALALPDGLNALCPVTGAPAKAAFTLEHQGRRIAFCCANCPKVFAADPAAYASKL